MTSENHKGTTGKEGPLVVCLRVEADTSFVPSREISLSHYSRKRHRQHLAVRLYGNGASSRSRQMSGNTDFYTFFAN